MATATEMKTLFPQFAATDDSALEAWFAQAALRFTLARFGSQADMLQYCFAGHNITLFNPDAAITAGQGDNQGAITSRKVEDFARSYAAPFDMAKVPSSLSEFTATSYGMRLIGIVLSRAVSHATVVRTGPSVIIPTTTTTSS